MKINDGTKDTGSHWHSFFDGKEHTSIITVDFDHTITLNCPACPDWKGEYVIQEGVKETLEKLHDLFEIVILSGGGNFRSDYKEIIRAVLEKNNIPFDRIEDRKPPAVFMIDDRAIHHRGWHSTLTEINQRMKVTAEKECVIVQISEESAKELFSKGAVEVKTEKDKDFLIVIHGRREAE